MAEGHSAAAMTSPDPESAEMFSVSGAAAELIGLGFSERDEWASEREIFNRQRGLAEVPGSSILLPFSIREIVYHALKRATEIQDMLLHPEFMGPCYTQESRQYREAAILSDLGHDALRDMVQPPLL